VVLSTSIFFKNVDQFPSTSLARYLSKGG
jgi:hypothetical protein